MSIKRILALTLAMTMAAGSGASVLVAAGQQNGVLGGKATDKVSQPYAPYNVRARVVNNAAIAETVPLDAQGMFSIANLPLSQSYLIELFDTRTSKILCTEGPFALGTTMPTKTDINIDCGVNPAAWLLAAGAGAALIAAATQSSSQ
jgi:hypothetical protein